MGYSDTGDASTKMLIYISVEAVGSLHINLIQSVPLGYRPLHSASTRCQDILETTRDKTGYTRRMKVHTGYILIVSMLILHSLIV
jgi:hypothetical protein